MNQPKDDLENLFSYGTLQLEPVQISTFGRKLETTPDILPGYENAMVAIDDPEVVRISGKAEHPIIRRSKNPFEEVRGSVLRVTFQELANADKYEVSAYKRVSVQLSSGKKAWAYVDARDPD